MPSSSSCTSARWTRLHLPLPNCPAITRTPLAGHIHSPVLLAPLSPLPLQRDLEAARGEAAFLSTSTSRLESEAEAARKRVQALGDDLEEARAPYLADQGERGEGRRAGLGWSGRALFLPFSFCRC